MNILILSHYAGSAEMGMVFRPYYFAKEWVKLGHSVTIVASSFSHTRRKNFDVSKSFEEAEIDGIKYVLIKTPKYKNIFQRVINLFSFVFKLKFNVKKIAEKYSPDVIISSCTYNLDIYSAVKIAKYSKAKLVYEVRDLWPLSPMELGGFSRYNPFIMLLQHAENTAYKKSDFVVSVLPCVHEYMSEHGLNLNKLHIIPNGVDEDSWNPEFYEALDNKTLLDTISNERKSGNIIVGYAGAHGSANAMSYLLEATTLLRNNNISFILVGRGKEKEKLQQYAKDKKINNIFFFDPIPKSQIPSLLPLFDIVYIGWNPIPIYRFGISPNKLMDYMMASKPIVHSVTAGNDLVADAGCGISVEAANPQAIADAILKLASLTDEERQVIGQKGHDYIVKNQSYKILAKQFLDMLGDV